MSLIDIIRSWFHPHRPPPISPLPVNPAGETAQVVAHANRLRRANGLPPLAVHPDLTRAAAKHAADMAAHQVSMDKRAHRGSDGSIPRSRILDAGYEAIASGECIAVGQTIAEDVVATWEHDLPHREIILGSFWHIGVGRSGAYWCADLASPV